jgi:pyrimidine deaminase RibD-like protein
MLPNRILTPRNYMQIAVQVGMENFGKTGVNPSVGAIIVQ